MILGKPYRESKAFLRDRKFGGDMEIMPFPEPAFALFPVALYDGTYIWLEKYFVFMHHYECNDGKYRPEGYWAVRFKTIEEGYKQFPYAVILNEDGSYSFPGPIKCYNIERA